MPGSSFIICTKNRYDDIIKCIETILKQTILPYELIIVDASDTEKNRDVIQGMIKDSGIQLKYKHTKPNTAYQRNVGIAMVDGDLVFFFDDDVILNNDYHEKILDVYKMDKNQEVAGVTGTVTNTVENPFLGKVFRAIFLLSTAENNLGKKYPSFSLDDGIISIDNMLGCQMSFRRNICNEYQFDPFMGQLIGYAFLEDREFTLRVAQKNIMLQTPFAKAYHSVSPVAREKINRLQAATILNTHYIFRKNITKTFKNCVVFSWKQIGLVIHAFAQAIRKRNIGWITGVFEGYKLLGPSKKLHKEQS